MANATIPVIQINEGKVGIGTTSPSRNLHVHADSGNAYLQLTQATTGTTSNDGFQISMGAAQVNFINRENGNMVFETNNTEKMRISSTGKVGIGTTSPVYKLDVNGGVQAGGKVTYTKSAGSLNTTGYAVAGITADANGNGSSCGFTFTCFGQTGGYQKIVYSCYNGAGTWYAKKVINEGTNQLDVVASANGSTITFTFKAISSTMYYTPRVTVEATGHNINSTYA